MSLTSVQQSAVDARGNVLVSAGAGTGKTRTLVERCLACLLHESPPASIDEILMVTFTEAAAAEMRHRIRQRLEQEKERAPANLRWQEQLALFETAHLGTLHSFCFQLVRQHFYEVALDPQLAVLAEEEARLLADETLDQVLQRHYAGDDANALAVQRLIQIQGGGWDKPIRALVLQIHRYAQALPNPVAWLSGQLAQFATAEPVTWRAWLERAAAEFALQWLPRLEFLAPSNGVAALCVAALRSLPAAPSAPQLAPALEEIRRAGRDYPRGKKALWIVPIADFLGEAEFLASLLPVSGSADPLKQDWDWVRDNMTVLLQLVLEFSWTFTETKRELGVLDFQDLEQYSLRLLWDPAANQPTDIARQWRDKLRFIFVDEYQDINAAQDQIIQALARGDSHPNRFLVGDVKQSIYRFRLANPKIFQDYARQWSHGAASVISLVDNFRAREALLHFVNSVFGLLVTPDLAGFDYGKNSALRFGAPEKRAPLGVAANPGPAVELHLLVKSNNPVEEENEDVAEPSSQISELLDAEKEARLVGLRLRELHAERHRVWDEPAGQFRPVEWRDMVILLRSPSNKAESYAKQLARLEVPLQVIRPGFYQSLEVSDLVSLLQVLDNPLQDLPLLAVLHSPLVGLSAAELAELRLAAPKTRFWNALLRWHAQGLTVTSPAGGPGLDSAGPPPGTSETRVKVQLFLDRYAAWRRLARQASLSRCLETVLAETQYHSWLLTQGNGAQRYANIQRLLTMAQEFDRFQRQGLFRFLAMIQARQSGSVEPEVPAVAAENAVRLMSIHQSKGLEFPVVVLADLGKRFNLADLSAEVILDEQYGLCPQIKPPQTGKRYPSLAHWLGSRRHLRELLGEELRLLYVAFTRARDTLVLTGSVTPSRFARLWSAPPANADATLRARSYADWLAFWFAQNVPASALSAGAGQNNLLRWFVHSDSRLVQRQVPPVPLNPDPAGKIDFASASWRALEGRLQWQYPFAAATEQPAKTSVSALSQQALVDADDLAFAPSYWPPKPRLTADIPQGGSIGLSAAEIGSAHHLFLQLVSFEATGSASALRADAERLVQALRLSQAQAGVLDFDALARFWCSDLGTRIRQRARLVHRELPFTARFTPAELAGRLNLSPPSRLEGEFVLVQGVADLVVIGSDDIWLVDFKTDQFEPGDLPAHLARYQPQIELYALALSRIYQRPVSEAWLHFLCLRESVRLADRI
jgi:ATP-dependent helicase/nuclease subunit A